VDSFRLVFKTPTCFSALGRKYFHLFPDATYVFGGLLELWSMFSHDKSLESNMRDEYMKWIVGSAGVSGFELATKRVLIGRRSSIGFAGWVNYRLGEGDRWRKLTAALARFAEFSNVGKNRTAGLGVTRYLEKPEGARLGDLGR
jgi:CRISPR-associated endoribonuclease Cas6